MSRDPIPVFSEKNDPLKDRTFIKTTVRLKIETHRGVRRASIDHAIPVEQIIGNLVDGYLALAPTAGYFQITKAGELLPAKPPKK